VSLGVCIPDLIAAGKIPPEHAARVREIYDRLLAQHEGAMARPAAEALATSQAIDAWEEGLRQARAGRLLSLNRQQAIIDNARRFRGWKDGDPIDPRALTAHLAWDPRAPYANVEYVEREIRQSALGMMYGILAKHRADLLGRLRNQDDLTDLVRELHGRDTGNLGAKELADSWRRTSEYLRARFNAAGGAIGKLEDWGLPQSHDPLRVGAVSREQWIDELIDGDMLDRARMIDRDTLQPMDDDALRELLSDAYDTIVSDGWIGRQPGANQGRSMIANRHGERRVLHFRDADAWIAYNERYGRATPWDAMMGHVGLMARDTALIEVLGPNPAATVRWMKDLATKDAHEKGGRAAIRAAEKGTDKIDGLWRVLTGEASRAVDERLAHAGASIRQWQAATKLGGAVITSLSDLGTAALTRHFNGLATFTHLPDMLAQLNPADATDRALVRGMGIIGDEFTGHVAGQGRIMLEELSGGRHSGGAGTRAERWAANANEVTRRLADGTLRASGLNAWTIAGREATAKAFALNFAAHAGRTFDQLDPRFRRFFERNGMGAAEWDAIRVTAPNEDAGYKAIWPVMVADEAVGRRLMQAMLVEIDFAVPTTGLRTREFFAGRRPGTVRGEAMRMFFQFKGFPITVMIMHGMRMLDLQGGWSKAKYGVSLLGATTMMGALSYQLANLKDGKDPADMTSRDFWWRAMLKGGGLGVFGDVVNASQNQYGQDLGDLVAGPGIASMSNLGDLVWGKVETNDAGEKVRTRDFASFLARETPGGSIWYVRQAYHRLLLDRLKEAQDEDFAASYRAMERRAAQDGAGYFWQPGAESPERGPDFMNALGAPEAVDGEAALN
jgi:hypothetical protein